MPGNKESTARTLVVALVVSLVAAVFVAGSAVSLKPIQERNRLLDRQRSILAVAGIGGAWLSDQGVQDLFQHRIKAEVIDLSTGEVNPHLDPLSFDPLAAARDPKTSTALTSDQDSALIKRREQHTTLYRLEKNDGSGELEALILPVRGYGLWSTLYGFLAIKPDLNTVIGLGFYQHGETPGLGGEVDNPRWKALWPGKTLFDGEGQPNIRIVKGHVAAGNANAGHEVDGLAGATLTSNGVNHLLTFWLGEQGFGPYLAKLRQQRVSMGDNNPPLNLFAAAAPEAAQSGASRSKLGFASSSQPTALFVSLDAATEPVQMAEAVQSAPKAASVLRRTVCGSVSMTSGTLPVVPLGDMINALRLANKPHPVFVSKEVERSARITILKQPKHGALDAGAYGYTYTPYKIEPDDNYEDQFTMQVVYKGKVFILNYRVMYVGDLAGMHNNCREYPFVKGKISTAPAESFSLSALLANAATAVQGFADLSGLSTGQTVGDRITLDDNAAGHGWYIDPTPLDNTDDYLPTADPNIWKAIPGSAAEGRMDMLSVLLHEYGHVLGLEHSADPRSFMTTTLQPGVRRLPSAAELQRMSEHIARIKAGKSATNTPRHGFACSLDSRLRGNDEGSANEEGANHKGAAQRSSLSGRTKKNKDHQKGLNHG